MSDRWNEAARALAFGRQVRDLANKDDFGSRDLLQIATLSRAFQIERLAAEMVDRIGCWVHGGPFRSMKLAPVQLGSLLMPKILGTYEDEVAHLFRDLGRFRRLVDIGSAEGYYAVGCPFAHSHIETIAFDTSVDAQRWCRHAAMINHVQDRVDQRGFCSSEELASLATRETLVVIDIDGAEVDLLCSLPARALAEAEIIVEVHQSGASTTQTQVIPHFADTHDITIYKQKAKDVGAFSFFNDSASIVRFLATWEGRRNEAWLHLRPKN